MKEYLIGVDGGGTKTTAALANLKGKILAKASSGPSNLRNVGIKESTKNIAEVIGKVLKKIDKNKKISSTFIGLAAVEEEFKLEKEEIKKEISKYKEISEIFGGKVKIGSDQIVAFYSGADKKEGIVLIAGTGCVVHGWHEGKEAKVSGWGYLNDEGSAFWTGQKAFQAIFKDLNGREPKTLITKLVLQRLKVKNKIELMLKIYSKNSREIIPSLSILVDKASQRGDKIASLILAKAGEELAQAAKTVIKKLNFQYQKFPVVLIGGMFKSKIVSNKVKREIKKIAPRAKFIQPRKEPVIGAVKLALENLKMK